MRKYRLIFAGENACVITLVSLTCSAMKSKLIVALDVDHLDRAHSLIRELRDHVDIFKVGSQLFTAAGPAIVAFINEQNKKCFLDLKFHDIPNTVAKAVESVASLRVTMLTIHASGGAEMLRAASGVSPRPVLLGVTVLTSVAGDVRQEVLRLAKLSKECGLDGIIASPHEIRLVREELGEEFLIVTPGIRPVWAEAGDQKRVTTPGEVVAAGADYIVVGRPIIAANDPATAARRIIAEIVSA